MNCKKYLYSNHRKILKRKKDGNNSMHLKKLSFREKTNKSGIFKARVYANKKIEKRKKDQIRWV